MPGEFKGTVFRKNRMGGYMLALGGQFPIFIFWLSLNQKLLYAYTENTLNGEISSESVYISVNNNTNLKKNLILSIYTIWDRLSLKTISRYCPTMESPVLPAYAGDGTGERRVPELQRPQADRSPSHHLDDRQLQAQQGELTCSLKTLINRRKNAIKKCIKSSSS
jgi:hypothetical protein